MYGLHETKPTPFHERTDLRKYEATVGFARVVGYSVRYRDQEQWQKHIVSFSKQIGREPTGVELLALFKLC